eukprot:jgi/Ulvmu1/766/UM010_0140.1
MTLTCAMCNVPRRASVRSAVTLRTPRSTSHVARVAERQFESIIPEVLDEIDSDEDYQAMLESTIQLGQAALTRAETAKRQAVLNATGIAPWAKKIKDAGVSPLVRSTATIFQLNIGLYCNQACTHCHVESSPKRTEMMDRNIAERCLTLLRASPTINTLDLTGGAPELNSQFRYLVEEASQLDVEIIDRCNLTVLVEPGQEDLPTFLAKHKVRVVASLPCYSKDNVDSQRGGGTFRRSIEGLRRLNAVGYGQPDSGLMLDLVYNPNGIFLAPEQSVLEPAYKSELQDTYDIQFNSLLCLNNMPIKRYWDYLQRKGEVANYMQLLEQSFNPAAGETVMCRDTVSVSWDGSLYDCDFNQQLAMGMAPSSGNGGPSETVFTIESLDELTGRRIACDNHCYGCTAGSGSSCQGQ